MSLAFPTLLLSAQQKELRDWERLYWRNDVWLKKVVKAFVIRKRESIEDFWPDQWPTFEPFTKPTAMPMSPMLRILGTQMSPEFNSLDRGTEQTASVASTIVVSHGLSTETVPSLGPIAQVSQLMNLSSRPGWWRSCLDLFDEEGASRLGWKGRWSIKWTVDGEMVETWSENQQMGLETTKRWRLPACQDGRMCLWWCWFLMMGRNKSFMASTVRGICGQKVALMDDWCRKDNHHHLINRLWHPIRNTYDGIDIKLIERSSAPPSNCSSRYPLIHWYDCGKHR